MGTCLEFDSRRSIYIAQGKWVIIIGNLATEGDTIPGKTNSWPQILSLIAPSRKTACLRPKPIIQKNLIAVSSLFGHYNVNISPGVHTRSKTFRGLSDVCVHVCSQVQKMHSANAEIPLMRVCGIR